MKKLLAPTCVLLFVFAMPAAASPAKDVSFELLARGDYEPFKLNTDAHSPVDFQAKARSPLDIVVRRHTYGLGGHTGWHKHPGPVFITVLQGTVAFYAYDDPTCTPTIVEGGSGPAPLGQGYVDDGHGHIGVNVGGDVAIDVSVIIAPDEGAFREELDEPAFSCGF